VEFGVLAVGNGLPTSGKNFFNGVRDVEFIGGPIAEPVDAGAEGFRRMVLVGCEMSTRIVCGETGGTENNSVRRRSSGRWKLPRK